MHGWNRAQVFTPASGRPHACMHRAYLLMRGCHGHGEVQERLDSGQNDGLQSVVCVEGALIDHKTH